DAPGHVMSGSNDIETRRQIFGWIKQHENVFYRPRSAIRPLGVYFLPATRNYYAQEFVRSYQGILILLMQKHLEFQIVTPRTIKDFAGETLILPDVRVLDTQELKWLKQFAQAGKQLVVTGADATELGKGTP